MNMERGFTQGVIEKNKKGAVFCPTGYMLVLLQQNKSEKTVCKSSHKGILKENKTMNQTKKQLVNPTEKKFLTICELNGLTLMC